MDSFIKLYRRFLKWRWSDTPNMVSLFIHLLLRASYEDMEWHGITIKRGELVTGRKALAKVVGISEQNIRTCLAKLQATGEISLKSTNKYTIITITNYDTYQQSQRDDQPTTNQQLTNNQPTTNQQLTTQEEVKEIEEINNNIINACAHARTRLENQTIYNSLWLSQAAMNLRTDKVLQLAAEVLDEWELTKTPEEEYTAYHLLCHMRKKLEVSRRNNGNPTSKDEWRASLMKGAMEIINKHNKQ